MPLIGPCLLLVYSSASALLGSMVKERLQGDKLHSSSFNFLISFANIHQGLANIERDLAAMYESKKDWRLFANSFIIWKVTWAVVTPSFLLVRMLYIFMSGEYQSNFYLYHLSLLSFIHCSRAKTI